MKITTLPGLEIDMVLPRCVQLRVDGEVPSLLRHIAKSELAVRGLIGESRGVLEKLFGHFIDRLLVWSITDHLTAPFPDLDLSLACCYELKPSESERLFIIAVRQGLERNMARFAYGHESGEFLQKIGRQDLMQEALRTEGLPIDATRHAGEDFADLGGFLALLKAQQEGDETIRIPAFKSNGEGRAAMGRQFRLEPSPDSGYQLPVTSESQRIHTTGNR